MPNINKVVSSLVTLLALFTIPAQALGQDSASSTAEQKNPPVSLFSPDDGWLDMSQFVDQAYGFIPIIVPITEPAVGIGALGALVFIDKPEHQAGAGFGRPNITMVGGLATENGTKGAIAGDIRYWMDDSIKTVVALLDTSVNLDYYGIGSDGARKTSPVTYNMEVKGGVAQANFRFGQSRLWGGLAYVSANVGVAADLFQNFPALPDFKSETSLGGLVPSLSYDSRNNIFTPTGGSLLSATFAIFDQSLGSDNDFTRYNVTAIQYLPLHPKWTLGVFANTVVSDGDVPFYLRPFISLRGAPAMRYQGESTAEIEAEIRWQLLDRFSLIGFVGKGIAKSDFMGQNNDKEITTGGVGMRYEIARKYGMHMGIDYAVGPDEDAIYIQFGSAWMRP